MYQRGRELKAERSGRTGFEIRVRPGLFGNSFWDEAHTLKDTRSQRVSTLLKLKLPRVLLMTASPFVNRLRDLSTMLTIIHETGAKDVITVGSGEHLTIADYKNIRAQMLNAGGSWLKLDGDQRASVVRCLDVGSFHALMTTHDDNGQVAREVVPAPMGTIILRRVAGQKLTVGGQEVMIGADIPSYHCTTAEVSLGPVQEEIYTRLHREKFGAPDYFVVEPDQPRPIDLDKHLEAHEPEDDLQVRENADRARSLMCAASNAGIQRLYDNKVAANAKDVQTW